VCEHCSVVAAVTGQKELWNVLLNVSVTVLWYFVLWVHIFVLKLFVVDDIH